MKDGNRRIAITLPEKLIKRLEEDTKKRGLDMTKSVRIQLALEEELNRKDNKKDNQRGYPN